MAQLGMWKGAVDTGKVTQEGQKAQGPVLEGLLAFLVWRSAYWTKVRPFFGLLWGTLKAGGALSSLLRSAGWCVYGLVWWCWSEREHRQQDAHPRLLAQILALWYDHHDRGGEGGGEDR